MGRTIRKYDTLIIGSGPAGEGAAMTLTKAGQRVAVVEKHRDVGGGCTHWGTIPSKALRRSAQMLADLRNQPMLQSLGHIDLTYEQVLQGASSVVSKQVGMRRSFYHRNRVDVLNGTARFVDPQTVEIDTGAGTVMRCTAERFLIATGSTPFHPPGLDFSHPRVRDSDTVLTAEIPDPRSITIYGAGVIGCEYASFFGALGLKVNLVNGFDRLLAFLDGEISDALGYHLREQGVTIRHNEAFAGAEVMDDQVVMYCDSGKQFKSDLLLWANGRSGNTAELGLDTIGVETTSRGQVTVNAQMQTAGQPHIYAAGDVIGPPGLASASYDQGRYVARQILNEGVNDDRLVRSIPTGIFTSPEISSLGKTERELTDAKVPYEVGRSMFRSIARAQIDGQPVGMLKMLFHSETLEILGLHCFGSQSSEIIHIGQAVMTQPAPHNSIKYFVNSTFNYPTMAEAYRVAALNGLNRL